jgi:riboflavin kinase/FMN adenylyltransferase
MKKQGSVITIGAFDGIHKGHSVLIKECIKIANQNNFNSVIIVLEKPVKNINAVLSLPNEKIEKLENFKANRIIAIRPNSPILLKTADKFLNDILIKRLNIKALVCGENFAFGKNRQGNIKWLKKTFKEKNIALNIIPPLKYLSKNISSSYIRQLIEKSNTEKVALLLGDYYSFDGIHFREKHIASKLGFPTINLKVDYRKLLPLGVFACLIKQKKKYLPAIANIGYRPTIDKDRLLSVEIHILNFSGVWNIKQNNIKLIKLIRKEKAFSSLKALSEQIKKDVKKANKYFDNLKI